MRFVQTLLDLLYPPRCAACGLRGVRLCQACIAHCVPLPPARRPRALPAETALRRALGIYPFDGVIREAIHVFKYNGERGLAQPLARLLVAHCPMEADALIAVPLHAARQRERGFNQAQLLAQELGQHWRIPVVAGLARVRSTDHQVGQSARERAVNVQGAFMWRSQTSPPPRVLLIDDVLTTGSTLMACAAALQVAGASDVEGLTLARARA